MPEVSETIPDALAPRVDAALAWFNSSAESAGDIFKVTGILDADAALNGSDELDSSCVVAIAVSSALSASRVLAMPGQSSHWKTSRQQIEQTTG